MFFKKAATLMALCLLGIGQMAGAMPNSYQAQASSFETYSLPFSYENYIAIDQFTDDEVITQKEPLQQGSNIESATLYYKEGLTAEQTIKIYGTRTENGFYKNDGQCYISFTDGYIDILGNGFRTYSTKVVDDTGAVINSGSKSLTFSNLKEGTYDVRLKMLGLGVGTGTETITYMAECEAAFTIDKTAPKITGADLSQTGKHTDKPFTVIASDTGSGVKGLYMKSPDKTGYVTCGKSATIDTGSKAGLYSFYAIDNLQNRSATYYVNYEPCLNGHIYLDTILEATCTENGGTLHTCGKCGYSYLSDKKPPTGHSYTSEIVTIATCTETGERQYTCEDCKDTYTSTIPKTGHTYQITDEENQDGSIKRTYSCANCLDTYTQNLGNSYARVTNYVTYLFHCYSPYMVWIFLATAGVWSVVMGVMLVVANKNEEKEKAKKMIVNYCIGLIVIFGILIACPYLINGIASLIA